MLLRLLALCVLVSVLSISQATASSVAPEACPAGAISALGPVDANGRGDTAADVRCLAP